ncbi:hypothetical protein DPMN_176371 [Dreissena polymorpha]|uniref:Uncharacterized protein n=1 Tax=Dreissena polymorpha TaxID=45954 RepID=A0A9D4E858_DREPO|nr:hypothetical protein DPMN_176371 [Dreissena polymorpha]
MEHLTNYYIRSSTFWPIQTPLRDSQTTKAGLVLTDHQAPPTEQDCAPGNPRGRLPFRPSVEKPERKFERVEFPFPCISYSYM